MCSDSTSCPEIPLHVSMYCSLCTPQLHSCSILVHMLFPQQLQVLVIMVHSTVSFFHLLGFMPLLCVYALSWAPVQGLWRTLYTASTCWWMTKRPQPFTMAASRSAVITPGGRHWFNVAVSIHVMNDFGPSPGPRVSGSTQCEIWHSPRLHVTRTVTHLKT